MSNSLIPSTQNEREQVVAIQQIRTDMGTQSRLNIDPDAVERYKTALEKGIQLPPLRAVKDANGDIILWDGFHRIEAAERANMPAVKVMVMPGTIRDAVLLSLSANETHGLPRSHGDRKKAILTMLGDSQWSQWSHIDIARACDVDESYVRRIRKEEKEKKAAQNKPKDPPAASTPATAPAITPTPTPVTPTITASPVPATTPTPTPKPDCPVFTGSGIVSGVTPPDATLHMTRDVSAIDDTPDNSTDDPKPALQTPEERAKSLPLYQALALHIHGGATFLKQAKAFYFMEDELRDLKRAARATFTHHDSGPFTDAIRAVNKIPTPDQWTGCPHCHGVGVSPTLGDDCNYCGTTGFVFENGVTPGAVAKYTQYDNSLTADDVEPSKPREEPTPVVTDAVFDDEDGGPDYDADADNQYAGSYPYDIADAHAGD